MDNLTRFREVWLVDTEFHAPSGERPTPICLAARELSTGQQVQRWLWDDPAPLPPFYSKEETLFVAFYASAELGVYLACDWPMPVRILDLYAEFRLLTSGRPTPCGNGLLGALAAFGLPCIDGLVKENMQRLAIRGGPFTVQERQALLTYCQQDADALARLLPAMLPCIDLPRALLRGRYLAAVARMEWTGVPIDTDSLTRLQERWTAIKGRLIEAIDADYGVFVPTNQRRLDPESRLGAAILQEAKECGIDAHQLAEAVDHVWREEKEAAAESRAARKAARQATGLTHHRINRWEDAGRDSSSWPGLDGQAQELADGLPALGIGTGGRQDREATIDSAGSLWAELRDRDETVKPKHDASILSRAAELVAASPAAPPTPMTFSAERFADYLARHDFPWPRLPGGALELSDDAFRDMAASYPDVKPLHDLRVTLAQLRNWQLQIGSDGRNRVLLSPFASKTSRNQPSNSRFGFGPSIWMRSLIRPAPGMAVAYIDWEQQEFGIGAALAGDKAMSEAYRSGDPYLTFAKQAGAVPPHATKQSHKAERDLFKLCALGVQYGMGAESLARRIGKPVASGRELLRLHHETYPAYWRWSDAVQDFAMLRGWLETVFGWRVHVGPDANPRSLRNFPLQANGAEMLRLACCLATERGIQVCAPIHDALLVEGPAGDIEAVVKATQAAMREASELVLPDFPLRSDARVFHWPDRYADDRGRDMWELVWRIMGELETAGATPITGDTLFLSPAIPPSSLMSSLIEDTPCP